MSFLRSCWRSFRAEAWRLFRSRWTFVAALLLILTPIMYAGGAHLGALGNHARLVAEGSVSGERIVGNAWAPFIDAWLAGLKLAALLLLLLFSRCLAGDIESGLLRLSTTRSISRTAAVIGRALLAPLLVACAVLLTAGAAQLSAGTWFAFGPLEVDGYELFSEEELAAETLRATWALLPPLFATCMFGLFVSSLCRGATAAVILGLGLTLFFDLFKEVLGQGQYWFFLAFNPSLLDGSCMQEMSGIARGYSDSGYADMLYRMNMSLPLPQAFLFLLLACYATSRRSL